MLLCATPADCNLPPKICPSRYHLVQSYLAKFFRLRELQSGKGLSVQICSLGSQESLCKISTNFQLKKMCYSDFKIEVTWAPLKFYYRTFFLELEAQQGVQNDRNQHIILDERGFQSSQTFSFRNNCKKMISRAMKYQKSTLGDVYSKIEQTNIHSFIP